MYIEAPMYSVDVARLTPSTCLFLAGSITGAHDWQQDVIKYEHQMFGSSEPKTLLTLYNVFNPRRVSFDATKKDVEEEQITWEYHCIHQCDNILFWFSNETLAPISLFELGSALNTHDHDNIFIGVSPEYKRLNDVIIQTRLRDKHLACRIVYSVEDLAKQAITSMIAKRQQSRV